MEEMEMNEEVKMPMNEEVKMKSGADGLG